MSFKKFFKSTVLRFDLFSAPPVFRYNRQPNYETLFGGILSLIMIIAFTIIFANSFIKILSKITINSIIQSQLNPTHGYNITDIYFGFGIEGIDFRDNLQYFSVSVTQTDIIEDSPTYYRQIELQSCKKSVWVEKDPGLAQYYTDNNLQTCLCPKQDQNLNLYGFKNTPRWDYISLKVSECVNTSTWTCYSPSQISSFISNHSEQIFRTNIYWLDKTINAERQNYLSIALDIIAMPFSSITAYFGELDVGTYEVDTDESIWPTVQQNITKGSYLEGRYGFTIQKISNTYVQLNIKKSPKVFHVMRTHGKIDGMLSYAGGLFSLLFILIFFFFGSYSQYGYELTVADRLRSQDSEKDKKCSQKNYHFFTFLKYAIYDWAKAFYIKISWKQMEDLDQKREQAIQQMDIRCILKRIENLQKINSFLLEEHQILSINLTKPFSLQRMRKLRKISEYYDKFYDHDEMIYINKAKVADSSSDTIEQVSEMDQDDQQAEKFLIKSYKKIAVDQKKPLNKKILHHIPESMKKSFDNIKNLNVLEITSEFKINEAEQV